MITVTDYGVGNLASIQNMLRRLGHPAVIFADPAIVAAAGSMFVFNGPHRAVLISYPAPDVLQSEVFPLS